MAYRIATNSLGSLLRKDLLIARRRATGLYLVVAVVYVLLTSVVGLAIVRSIAIPGLWIPHLPERFSFFLALIPVLFALDRVLLREELRLPDWALLATSRLTYTELFYYRVWKLGISIFIPNGIPIAIVLGSQWRSALPLQMATWILVCFALIAVICLLKCCTWKTRAVCCVGWIVFIFILLRLEGVSAEHLTWKNMLGVTVFALLNLGLVRKHIGRAYLRYLQSEQVERGETGIWLLGKASASDWILSRLSPSPFNGHMLKEQRIRDRDSLFRFVSVLSVVMVTLASYWYQKGSVGFLDRLDQVAAGVAVISSVSLYSLIDSDPSPFGKEGGRLQLYWTSRMSNRMMHVYTVLCQVTFASVPIVLAGSVIFAFDASFANIVAIVLFSLTTNVTIAATLVASSAYDIDLNRIPTSANEEFVLRHLPTTLPRMIGLGLSLVVGFLSILVIQSTNSVVWGAGAVLLQGPLIFGCLALAAFKLRRRG